METPTIASAGVVVLLATATALATLPTPNVDDIIHEAQGHRSIAPVRPEKPIGLRAPLATRLGLNFIPAPVFSLAPIDHVDLIIEGDQLLSDGEPLRYGVLRTLDIQVNDGQWLDVPNGRIWQVEIRSVDAENIIVNVESMSLPEGAELRAYPPHTPENVTGPFTDDGPNDDGRIQSLIQQGDSIIVEYFEPLALAARGLPFEITGLIHGYLPILKDGLASGAGSCHNHATCHSDWGDVGDATALIFSGGYVCSGQLIATSSQDETPYFITANHCISTQGEASGSQFYFRYERTNCTGSYSNGTSTSSATLTAEHPSSDHSLLHINGSLPSGVFFVGWTTSSPSTNQDVTCLHHPAGDYMRISFGDVNSNPVCGSSTYWFGVRWNDGVTEGGSSGSGAYRDSDQLLMGVLTCGASSCSNTSGLDGYGRFQRAYDAGFDDHLETGQPDDDEYEDNDDCSSAYYMASAGTHQDLTVKSTDEDWYRFNVPAGYTVTCDLDFAHSNGDIDLELYSLSCSGDLVDESTSNTNDESASWANTDSLTRRVYIHVFLYSGTENTYDISVSLEENPEPNGACCLNGSCSLVTEAHCLAANGKWEGPDTSCSGDPCTEPTGACCLNNECYPLTETICSTAGGSWEGEGIACEAETCGTICVGDINEDGYIDGADLAAVLGFWTQKGGDLDGDGTTDGQDLAIVLGGWGPCSP
jgi:hypothetical protein